MGTENGGDGDKTPTLEGLQEQIGNLNKGIATYRDDAQKATTAASEAKAEAAAAKKEAADAKAEAEALKQGKGDDKEIKLNAEDEKRLEAWAKSKGFVSKAEMEAQSVTLFQESVKGAENTAVAEFLEKHPEYSDKEKWDAVKKEFEQYKQPTSLTGYRTLLNKIHRELSADDDRAAEIKAKEEQKKRLGLGGRGSSSDNQEGEMTMEKLREKYPRLSEDQITSRLAEINDLAAERAKKLAAKNK